jgi:nucleoside permease NupC
MDGRDEADSRFSHLCALAKNGEHGIFSSLKAEVTYLYIQVLFLFIFTYLFISVVCYERCQLICYSCVELHVADCVRC